VPIEQEEVINNSEDIENEIEVFIETGTTSTVKTIIDELNGLGTITITGWLTIDSDLTIPNGIILNITNKGGFNIKNDSTLSIHGQLSAGLHPIFDNVVDMANSIVPEVKAEWFGQGGFGLRFALRSADRIPVTLNTDITVTNQIFLFDNQTLHLGRSVIKVGKLPHSFDNKGIFENDGARFSTINTNITVTGGIVDGVNNTDEIYCALRFIGVNNSLVNGMKAHDITQRPWNEESGAFRFEDVSYTTVQNIEALRGYRMGVYFGGNNHHNKLLNSHFKDCRDSGFGGINPDFMEVDGNLFDNCGNFENGRGASNATANLRNSSFTNNTSINATGTANSNGFTLGHPTAEAGDLAAYNNLVDGNLIMNCDTKGIVIQGAGSYANIISNNIIINCGLLAGTNRNNAGIALLQGTIVQIENNQIIGCQQGISINNGVVDTYIFENTIKNSVDRGIRNDGINTTVQGNNLRNLTNIFSNPNKIKDANLIFTNNNETPPEIPVNYSLILDLNLTVLQKDVLKKLLNLQ
tara:strand:+ start:788 stop:2359 length:1572 start_codon:yes stop_codon:yes gene_type:complete